MSSIGRFTRSLFSAFSAPKSAKPEQQLYRLMAERSILKIVEVGMHSLEQATKLIETAQSQTDPLQTAPSQGSLSGTNTKVHYTAFDRFDARSENEPALSLMKVYRTLNPTLAQVKLVPGSPVAMLKNTANGLQQTDLLLLNLSLSDSELEAAWFFIPRMLTENSLVLRETGPETFEELTLAEIKRRADVATPAARRAA